MQLFQFFQNRVQSQSLNELHDVIGHAVLLADSEYWNDVGVVQLGRRFRLAREAKPGARVLRMAPNGDIFLALSRPEGKIVIIRAGADMGNPKVKTFATDQRDAYGIAFYPPGPDPKWVYVGEDGKVVRFPYHNGDLTASGPAETVVADLATGGNHWTRDVAFSPFVAPKDPFWRKIYFGDAQLKRWRGLPMTQRAYRAKGHLFNAARWTRSVRLAREGAGENYLELSYETLALSPQAEAARLAVFLGLEPAAELPPPTPARSANGEPQAPQSSPSSNRSSLTSW